jgi:zinc and cadmium transporter
MLTIVCYSLVVIAVTWAAGLMPLAGNWRESRRDLLTAFAGGVLLGAAFLHMLPEAAHNCPEWVGPAALAGLLFVFLLERLLATHYCEHDHEACDHFQVIGYTFYVGLTLHSFIDGVVLASGALIPSLGPIVLVAILAHHLPVVFSLSSILLAAGFSRRRLIYFLTILSLSTPTGAFAAFLGLRGLGGELQSLAVAVSAGTFLYIALADLLPSISHERRRWLPCALALALGLGIMYLGGRLAHREAHGERYADEVYETTPNQGADGALSELICSVYVSMGNRYPMWGVQRTVQCARACAAPGAVAEDGRRAASNRPICRAPWRPLQCLPPWGLATTGMQSFAG